MDNPTDMSLKDIKNTIRPYFSELAMCNNIRLQDLKIEITKNLKKEKYHIYITNVTMEKKELKEFAKYVNEKTKFEVFDLKVYNS